MKPLTLRQEAAQMVMPRLDGSKLDDSRYLSKVQELIQAGIGGFILFGGTMEHTPRHLRELQGLSEIPLLIASDIERGLGQQIIGGTRFPNQRAVAAGTNPHSRNDVALLDSMLDAVRTETRAAGIHAVFSPVVDVNNNRANPIICTRAFGDAPDIVAWFGSRYIKRLQKPTARGRLVVLACAKHFPGHGDTDQDSHMVLPVIKANRPRLNRIELPPFRQAVKDGVAMIMVAHLMVPALDPEKPTTFSKKTVTALLREGMEFDGLIVSDALNMGALTERYAQEEIAVGTVEAGMDILLHPQDPTLTINAVVSAVEEGRLTRQRIGESVIRIMDVKMQLGLFDKNSRMTVRVNFRKHQRIARAMGRKSLHVLPGSIKILPLRRDSGIACFIVDDDGDADTGDIFVRTMKERSNYLSVMVLTPESDMPEFLVRDCIAAADIVVIAIYSKISASKGHSGIANALKDKTIKILRDAKALKANSIIVSFDSPYLLDLFKDADIRIAAHDRMDEIQQAVVELLIKA